MTSQPTDPHSSKVETPTRILPAHAKDVSGMDQETHDAMQALLAQRKKRKQKRIIVIVGVLAVVAVVVGIWRLTQHQADTDGISIPTTSIVKQDFTKVTRAQGKVEPVESYAVTPEVDGIIQSVHIKEGDYVEQGQVLLEISNDALDKSVREAGLQLRSAQNQLTSAREAYETAYAAYYRNEVDVATVNAAVDAVDSAQLSLEGAQESYNEAVAQADKRTVVSPVSGTVIVMNAVEGASVGAGTSGTVTGSQEGSSALIMIGDLSQMSVTVNVNELDITNVQAGQDAEASFAALPDEIIGARVTNISTRSTSSADQYGDSSVVSYSVKLLISDPPQALKPGMTAKVSITTQHIPDALMVSTSAIAMRDDGNWVNVVVGYNADGMPEAEEHKVEILANDAGMCAIEGDISEGDEVLDEVSGDTYNPTTSQVAA
ncbi:MAG: efflux RND transporter periplasmic adaptor subunit [Atopobiaceae bacterium]|jgi:HlyD family secretion protein